jgi:hypothetical protein
VTKVALLTPVGVAAVAVIALDRRPDASVGLADVRGRPLAWPAPGCFTHARLLLGGRLVDDVLAVGRDPGLELHVHGGAAVVQAVLAGLEASGASTGPQTVAPPSTLRAARARASVLHGELHRLAEALSRDRVPDELARRVPRALANARLASRLERPATVRIVGRPNAGKSTLFNALLMEDRALVSSVPGTTRDSVTALTQLEGVEVRLEDTEGGAPAEVSRPGADLLVHVLAAPGEASLARHACGVPLLRVLGRVDARALPPPPKPSGETFADGPEASPAEPASGPLGGLPGVSGRSGQGVPALKARIAAALGLCGDAPDDVLAPVDPGLRQLLRRVVSGPQES